MTYNLDMIAQSYVEGRVATISAYRRLLAKGHKVNEDKWHVTTKV